MSLKDRFVDGVGSLFDKLNDGGDLGDVDSQALERELRGRVAARKRAGSPKPFESAHARLAGTGKKARDARENLAAKRRSVVEQRKKKRASAKRRDEDAAFRNMAQEARQASGSRVSGSRVSDSRVSGSRASSSRASGSRKRRSPGTRPFIADKELASHYKTLGVGVDVSDKELKSAYRKLMRKYHPDLHREPRKKRAATQLATKISTAYAAIEKSRK